MSGEQKAEAKVEQVKGMLKETAGRLTGNERLTAEGRAEQATGDARQAEEKITGTFRH
ncbi:CsbD family protein [Streptomyces sp. NPDC004288]